MKNLKTKIKINTIVITAILYIFAFFESGFCSPKDFTGPKYGENYVFVEYKYIMYYEDYEDECAEVILEGLFYAYDYADKGDVLIVGIDFYDGSSKLYGLNSLFLTRYLNDYISSYTLLKNIYVLTL